ncbi:MAG: SCO family protein [Gracilimonas sp.]|uniref:SCO family protein n=1 Tax=Gracilimonas sp. TaxID=1974203 RepID=UPI0019C6C6EA|nr:SCO family protein [Gracilimonas sp.]MBD3615074.1 SCO family protein [Gracilimonas sp.]
MLITLFLSWVLIMIMAFIPVSDTAWGAFAEDFKVLCFGYDPETGSFQWIYMFMFTINPVMLALVIFFVWHEPLKRVFASPFIIKNHAAMAVFLVISVVASFLMMYEMPSEGNFEFRPEALRVSLSPPEFSLINHREEPVSLQDYKGKVVILTSIYATCTHTCPMILDQAKRTLNNLTEKEREEVILMAITMQPEIDTPHVLNRVADQYGFENYNVHLLTGDVDDVNTLLDRLNVSRFKMEDSPDISHANLFMVLDREGTLAYRFALGELQQDWMTQALKLLISEEIPDRYSH